MKKIIFIAQKNWPIINSEIKALLIDEVLFGRLKDGGKAKVVFNDSKYDIEFQKI